jgi:hypothetical protein
MLVSVECSATTLVRLRLGLGSGLLCYSWFTSDSLERW